MTVSPIIRPTVRGVVRGCGGAGDARPPNNLTNLLSFSRDFTNATWTKLNTPTVSYDQIGLDGAANTASYIDDSGANFQQVLQEPSITSSTDTYTLRAFLKKTTSETRRVGVGLQLRYATDVYANFTFNTNDGTLTARSSNAGTVSAVANSWDDDWWEVLIDAADNGSGNNTSQVQVLPAVATSDTGSWSSGASGDTIVGNVELYADIAKEAVSGIAAKYTT